MKKYLLSLALALTLLIGVSQAKAITMEELMAELASLRQELSSLKSSMGALTLSATSLDPTLKTITPTGTDTTYPDATLKTISTETLEASKVSTSASCVLISLKYTPTRTHHWTDNELVSSNHPEIKRYKIQWFSGSWSDWYYPGVNDVDTKETFRKVWRYFDDHNYEVETCDGKFVPIGSSKLISSATTTTTTTPIVTPTQPVSPTNANTTTSAKTIPTTTSSTATQVSTSTSPTFTKNLAYGLMNNTEVKKLQDFLIQEGYLQTGLNSGNYLGKTVSALQAFQKANNIQGDGRNFGPLTRNALLNLFATPRPATDPNLLTRRCNSTDAPWIQVLSPNGNEVYTAGQQITVKWRSCNLPTPNVITAQLNNKNNTGLYGGRVIVPQTTTQSTVSDSTQNDGQEIFTLLPVGDGIYGHGKNFEILLAVHYYQNGVWGSWTSFTDQSDNLFTINAPRTVGGSTSAGLPCLPGSSRIPCTNTINSKILYSGYTGVLVTNDLSNWQILSADQYTTKRHQHTMLHFGNKFWLIGGQPYNSANFSCTTTTDAEIFSSSDGISWAPVQNDLPCNFSQTGFVYDGKMWVIGGTAGPNSDVRIWSSVNGINWVLVNGNTPLGGGSSLTGHTVNIFQNKIWVLGGYASGFLNQVWCSADGGVTWGAPPNCSNNSGLVAPWSVRTHHSSLVFNNELWIFGGHNNGGSVADAVWRSLDGINWTPVSITGTSPFPRALNLASIWNGSIVLVGGWTGWTPLSIHKDVWTSKDGVQWSQVTSSPSMQNLDSDPNHYPEMIVTP
jgi:hypothetical protein